MRAHYKYIDRTESFGERNINTGTLKSTWKVEERPGLEASREPASIAYENIFNERTGCVFSGMRRSWRVWVCLVI